MRCERKLPQTSRRNRRAGPAAGCRRATTTFHFMRANGSQLREISRLIDSGVIRPVVDRIFPLKSTPALRPIG
ncbi:MAG: zinc-binding dehydrogenase [Pseudogulbenkiania sp.]|nr:zinc-binding dehydrogenase [Pseudogulbenkiania sp.]